MSISWNTSTPFKGIKNIYTEKWNMLFEPANLEYDFDKPLTPKILSDPNHKVVKHLIYIYSM